jgi:hypothetical protein
LTLKSKYRFCTSTMTLKSKYRICTSSERAYLKKSFLSTRTRMVARKPVRRRTVTIELKIENQRIWCTFSEVSALLDFYITMQNHYLESHIYCAKSLFRVKVKYHYLEYYIYIWVIYIYKCFIITM